MTKRTAYFEWINGVQFTKEQATEIATNLKGKSTEKFIQLFEVMANLIETQENDPTKDWISSMICDYGQVEIEYKIDADGDVKIISFE